MARVRIRPVPPIRDVAAAPAAGDGGLPPMKAQGWTMRDGVICPPRIVEWCNRLADASGIAFEVTSCERTIQSQARAMADYVVPDGRAHLVALYGARGAELWPEGAPAPTAEELRSTLEKMAAAGVRVSRHYSVRGAEVDAVDISIRNLTDAAQNRIIEEARKMGARFVDERKGAGPHMHFQDLK